MERILVVDDEKDIVSAIKIYLNAEGYEVFGAYSGQEALEILAREKIHLVLMDIMMPGIDGLEATSRLREIYNIPVILITAKGEDTDKVLGLTIGADDYVTKPFNPVELIARVKAQLRRYLRLGSIQENNEDLLIVGSVELNDSSKTLRVDGEIVNLTPTEFSILRLLMRHPGRVFSSAQVYEHIGGSGFSADNAIAVHIRHLREKIEIDPSNPRWLKVVWGQGYKMEDTQ